MALKYYLGAYFFDYITSTLVLSIYTYKLAAFGSLSYPIAFKTFHGPTHIFRLDVLTIGQDASQAQASGTSNGTSGAGVQ